MFTLFPVPGSASGAQLSAALGTATGENLTAVGGMHSLPEAVDLGAMELLGLIGTFRHSGYTSKSQIGRPGRGSKAGGANSTSRWPLPRGRLPAAVAVIWAQRPLARNSAEAIIVQASRPCQSKNPVFSPVFSPIPYFVAAKLSHHNFSNGSALCPYGAAKNPGCSGPMAVRHFKTAPPCSLRAGQ